MSDSEARAGAVLREVGEQIARLRATRGLALEDAAAEARIEAERLAGAECGELALDDAELRRLAETFNVDLTALFGGRVTPFSYLAGA